MDYTKMSNYQLIALIRFRDKQIQELEEQFLQFRKAKQGGAL